MPLDIPFYRTIPPDLGNRLRRFPHFHRHDDDGDIIPQTRSVMG